jgi:hypothetical protein
LINIVIYGFIVWVPTFLTDLGLPPKSSLGYTTLMSLGGPFGALIGAFLADRLGRKNGLIGAAVAAAVIGWLYSHSSSLATATLWGILLFTCTYLMVALGIDLRLHRPLTQRLDAHAHLRSDRLAGRVDRPVLVEMVEHHLRGSSTLLGLVAFGHDPHPPQGRKRHQTRGGSRVHTDPTGVSASSLSSGLTCIGAVMCW